MLVLKEAFCNVKACDFRTLIDDLAPVLLKRKYIKKLFAKKIIAREKQFPTGLSFDQFNVAIPHTDPQYVIQSGIIAIKLANPIEMTHMATTNQKIQVSFVFVLLVSEGKFQVKTLTELINHFKNKTFQQHLLRAQTKKEMFAIFANL